MKKLIFWISISFLTFWILSPIILKLTGLEFNNAHFQQSFEKSRFFGIPICILLTLFGTFQATDQSGEKVLKVLSTIGITVFVFFFMTMTLFNEMCIWTNGAVLFEHKQHKNVKIIERDYGCGATDSSLPIVQNFKIKEVTKYFAVFSTIDIEKIDQTKWTKK